MRAQNEFNQNSVMKRGIVVERDPAKMKVKVQFDDEDGASSMWIDVLGLSAGAVKMFSMPGEGNEVWCGMDAKGEDGCVLGSKSNNEDTPPAGSNDDIILEWGGGLFQLNTGSSAVNLATSGPVKVEAADIELLSATLTHNGKNIGHDHKHKDVTIGSGESGEPV